jgi:methyl-accepting chemotaxis protein
MRGWKAEMATSSAAPDKASATEERCAELIESFAATDVFPGTSGRLARAFAKLGQYFGRKRLGDLDRIARLSAEASETAVNVGWISHDVSVMAHSSRAICTAADQLTRSMQLLSVNATESAAGADQTRVAMNECLLDGEAATSAMWEVAARVSDIDARLGVLEGAAQAIQRMAGAVEAIAQRTNLLALNATIEAARAGTSGRGFVIVAAEVKDLSAKTEQVTGDIQHQLEAFAAEMAAIRATVADAHVSVRQGTDTVDRVAGRIGAANSAVSQVVQNANALAQVVDQQRRATADIKNGTTAIVGRISKTETEIDMITARLVGCESLAAASWVSAESEEPGAALSRLAAEAATFKREAARVLLRVADDGERSRLLSTDRLRLAHIEVRGGDELDMMIHQAAEKAREEAVKLAAAVAADECNAANEAYLSCEIALTELTAAARVLLGRLKDVGDRSL